ncbi:MAG TPA: GDSL-type esterase/lipase family protein [Cyclobacteriaceae bacterium]|nr:GDSL-type esterase/lipase family protein [Cyclobacteriaceae bacterium]
MRIVVLFLFLSNICFAQGLLRRTKADYPRSLNFTSVAATTRTVNWTATNGATNYILERATASDYSGSTQIYSGSNTTFNDSGLISGTLYYYRVKAQKTGLSDSDWMNTFIYPFTAAYYYGTSLVLGTGASPSSNRWTTLLSTRFGVTENNFGVGGQSITQVAASHFTYSSLATKPGGNPILFLEWSANDYFYATQSYGSYAAGSAQYVTDFAGLIAYAQASRGWAKADIVVIVGWDFKGNATGGTKQQLNIYANAMSTYCYTNGIKYVRNLPDYTMDADGLGIHPDNAGHLAITDYLEQQLELINFYAP